MKKIFYLFYFLPVLFLGSCESDKDLPAVDLTLTIDGVTVDDGSFYTLEGTEAIIDNIGVKSLNSKNNAGITNVIFYFNGVPLQGEFGSPFNYDGKLPTADLPSGKYNLTLTGFLLEEDKSVATVEVNYPIVIVENEESLPAGSPEIGLNSITYTIQPGK